MYVLKAYHVDKDRVCTIYMMQNTKSITKDILHAGWWHDHRYLDALLLLRDDLSHDRVAPGFFVTNFRPVEVDIDQHMK